MNSLLQNVSLSNLQPRLAESPVCLLHRYALLQYLQAFSEGAYLYPKGWSCLLPTAAGMWLPHTLFGWRTQPTLQTSCNRANPTISSLVLSASQRPAKHVKPPQERCTAAWAAWRCTPFLSEAGFFWVWNSQPLPLVQLLRRLRSQDLQFPSREFHSKTAPTPEVSTFIEALCNYETERVGQILGFRYSAHRWDYWPHSFLIKKILSL